MEEGKERRTRIMRPHPSLCMCLDLTWNRPLRPDYNTCTLRFPLSLSTRDETVAPLHRTPLPFWLVMICLCFSFCFSSCFKNCAYVRIRVVWMVLEDRFWQAPLWESTYVFYVRLYSSTTSSPLLRVDSDKHLYEKVRESPKTDSCQIKISPLLHAQISLLDSCKLVSTLVAQAPAQA